MDKTTIATSLKAKLMKAISSQELHSDFMDLIAQELESKEKEGLKVAHTFDPDYLDRNILTNILKTYGYNVALMVDNTMVFLKKEILNLPSFIRNKSTYLGYEAIFKLIEEQGETYNYVFVDDKLVKSLDYNSIVQALKEFPITISGTNVSHTPFNKVYPNSSFSTSFSTKVPELDYMESGRRVYKTQTVKDMNGNNVTVRSMVYSLDQPSDNSNDEIWCLDSNSETVSTKHISVEYYPNSKGVNYNSSLGIIDESDYVTINDNICLQLQSTLISASDNFKYNKNSLSMKIGDLSFALTFSSENNGIINYSSTKDYFTSIIYDTNKKLFTVIIKLEKVNDNYIINSSDRNSIVGQELILSYQSESIMNKDLYQYIDAKTNLTKKNSIIPHIGIMLNVICQKGMTTTIADLGLTAKVESTFNKYAKYVTSNLYDSNGNLVYTYGKYPIDSHEIYNSENWTIIQSYIKANDITDEESAISLGSATTYLSKTKHDKIYPKFFTLRYKPSDSDSYKSLTSDNYGNLYNSDGVIYGYVDYSSGDYRLNTTKKSYVKNKILANSSEKTYSIIYRKKNVIDNTFELYSDSNYTDKITDYNYTNIDNDKYTSQILSYYLIGYENKIEIFAKPDTSKYYLDKNLTKIVQQYSITNYNDFDYLYTKENDFSIYYTDLGCTKPIYVWTMFGDSTRVFTTTVNGNGNYEYVYSDISKSYQIYKYAVTDDEDVSFVYKANNTYYTDIGLTTRYTGKGIIATETTPFTLIRQSFNAIPTNMDVVEVYQYESFTNITISSYIKNFSHVFNEIIDPTSLKITYTIERNDETISTVTLSPNSNWEISKNYGIKSFVYDATTNKITLVFDTDNYYGAIDTVLCDYSYDDSLNIDTSSKIYLDYKTQTSLNVNRLNLLDDEGNIIAYTSVNDIEFDDINDHVSLMMAIKS